MASFRSWTLTVGTVYLFVLSLCRGIELEEIRPYSPRRMGARNLVQRDLSAFDLHSTQTFLWGSEDASDILLGNLTVLMPNDNENILSMEKFHGMLSSVKCSPQGMELEFEDDGSFAYAQKVWDWVNGADNHTFLMVAGKGDCGPNTIRTPYLVSRITYDEGRNIANLDATEGTWKDLAHSFELHVGRIPMDQALGLRRRDYTKDVYMDLATNLGMRVKVETGPIVGELVCDPCYTAGRMHFELVIKTWNFVPNGVVMKLSPEGVKVAASLRLDVKSNFGTKTKLPPFEFPKIPLSGVSIPGGVLTLGPVLVITLGGEVKLEGGISVTAGASATLPDSALMQVDLLSPSKNQFSGWSPDIATEPLKMQARVSATWKEYLEPVLQLQAEALGQGLAAGVSLRMPYVEVKAEGIVAQDGGACKKGDKYQAAVKVFTQWGFELKFRAGRTPGKNGEQDVDVTLASANMPLGAPACHGWDAVESGAPSLSSGSPLPTSPSGKSGNKCTNTVSGKSGTCMSTSDCKATDGDSAPGYCPNDPTDVQCCTAKAGSPSAGNPCNVGDATGECISTSSCSSSGKKSTPGHCPNDPTDIQARYR
ncbi:MAG: hypothetical protein M1837_002502 [Sclerophora amabilis]|nr:MAG: hypothetical protein M1837_002502 [Sclerophora amabilis]